ncbi:tyrosine-type recombinase/integrase [Marinospirillum sp. MEB164]|uniref:Tyrosine-type recombinase/integrase n=1 Tax=Marinospirillum alkalitolerans TaxID=3123374 RepID=A0ABW8PXU3_9GAMM
MSSELSLTASQSSSPQARSQSATELPVRCLERLAPLPAELSGASGRNRPPAHLHCQIDAPHDLAAVQLWLAEYQGQTYRTYRKEAERLLLWCWLQRGLPLSSLTREDLVEYQAFLADPQPAKRWCGHGRAPRHSDAWRPFQGPLSPASQQHALRILKGLFQYLHDAGYLLGNPLALMRHKGSRQEAKSVRERYLEQETWQVLVDYLVRLGQEQEAEPARQAQIARWHFLLHFLYLLAPRVHEVAQAKMQDFFYRRGYWWWAVEGKGGKYAEIPAQPKLIDALKVYRQHLGLSATEWMQDASPLVRNLRGTEGISANMIYRTMKDLTAEAAAFIEDQAPEMAATLRQASTHWFRHTSITHQADAGVELRYLARNARHSSLATTRLYLHEEDGAWQEQTGRHGLKPLTPE